MKYFGKDLMSAHLHNSINQVYSIKEQFYVRVGRKGKSKVVENKL